MSTRSRLLRKLSVSFAIVVALSCLSTAQAQSGRHVATSKSKPVAVANPEPEATPTPTTAAEKPKPVVRFVLGMDQFDGFSSVSLGTLSGVRRNCAQRLDDPEWVKVEVVQRTMLRSDAMKRARAEKDSYVVWLRIRENTMSSDTTGTPNNAYIEYTVFAPATAKVITSGATYPQLRNKSILDRTSDIGGDSYMNKSARDAADRILAKFRIHVRQPAP